MAYVAQKRLKHGNGFIEAGQEIPEKEFSFFTLEQMLRLGDIKLVVEKDAAYFAACPNFAACQKLAKTQVENASPVEPKPVQGVKNLEVVTTSQPELKTAKTESTPEIQEEPKKRRGRPPAEKPESEKSLEA